MLVVLPVRGPLMSTQTSSQDAYSGPVSGDGAPDRQARARDAEALRLLGGLALAELGDVPTATHATGGAIDAGTPPLAARVHHAADDRQHHKQHAEGDQHDRRRARPFHASVHEAEQQRERIARQRLVVAAELGSEMNRRNDQAAAAGDEPDRAPQQDEVGAVLRTAAGVLGGRAHSVPQP